MPSPHYDLVVLSRGGGYSALGRLDYIERGGEYASRAEEVSALGHAGPPVDWQRVDRMEYRSNAAVIYEITLPVPHMLPAHERQAVVQAHADYLWRELGLPSSYAIHARGKWDTRNVNAHIILPMRTMTEDGQFGLKSECPLQRINGGCARVAAMRGHWQDACNAAFRRCGFTERVDLRTLAAQGIDRPPQKRIPRVEYEMARRGQIHSPRYDRNVALTQLRTATTARADSTAKLTRTRRRVTRSLAGRSLAVSARRASRGRAMAANRAGQEYPVGRNQGLRPDHEENQPRERGGHRQDRRGTAGVVAPATDRQLGHGRVPAVDVRGAGGPDRAERDRVTEPEPGMGTGGTGIALTGVEAPPRPQILVAHTLTGGRFFVLADDLDHARATHEVNVPLCTPDGHRIEELHPGRRPGDPRGRLRLSSIARTEAMLAPEVKAEPVPVAAAPVAATTAGLVLDAEEEVEGYSASL